MRKHLSGLAVLLALTLFSLGVEAAVCTSQNAGNWNSSGTWDCGHVPFSSDTVVIAHNVTLDTDDTVAGLTINFGVTLTATNNDDLTVNGSIVNNGTYTSNGERLYMTGAGATLSGTGTFNDTRLYIDATNITLTAGSTMNFSGGANIRVGNNNDGSLTIAGTITDVGQPPGDRILRLDNNNPSSVTITGNLNTPNSYVEIQDGGTLSNNGSATIQYLDGNGDNGSTWTQGTNSNLTMTAPAQSWAGTFNASAPGNTVSYDGSATPLTPSSNTYYNVDGTYFDSPGACPTGFTVLGTSPCDAAGGTGAASTASGTCTSDPSNGGSYAWSGLNNVGASDDSHAQADGRSGSITEYLKCTGYNFNIPTDAIITGIELSIETHSESNRYFYDNFVHLVKNNTVQTATNKGTGTDLRANSDMVLSYGAQTDLWGGSWTPADINSTSFGAAFAAQRGNFNNTGTVFVDTMPITVHYTLPSGSGPVPTASYSMDEAAWNGTSGEVADSTGTSNGTSFNGANTIATGKICRAGSFDGINDYVEVPNLSAKLSGTASLAFWINTTQTGNDTDWLAPGVTGVELSGGADDIFWGWLDASGRIGISVGNDNTSKSTVPVSDGTWHHVVLTRDATNGAYKIYIDGSLNKSGTSASGVIGTAFSSIGRIEDTGGSPEYLQGDLDEVLIFDSVLSDAEVVAGYNNQAAGNNWDGSAHTCPGTGPTPTCSTFADTFSTVSYSRNDGTVNWTGNWIEVGDDNSPSNGDIRINNNALELRGGGFLSGLLDLFGGNDPFIFREADLSVYTSATLTFDYSNSGNWEPNDTLDVMASADGGANWTQLKHFTGNQNPTVFSMDISAYISANFRLAFVIGSGRSNERFYIDNVEIEACGVTAPDHFRFEHDGGGLTCNLENIVVRACMDTACNTEYPDPVTATLTPGGWVGGDTQTFASGDTLQLWYKTAGTATLDIASIVGAANPARCFVGGIEQPNCDMPFYDSGFLFDVPHHTAATAQTVTLAAVRTDLTTQQCVPTFQSVSKSVNFWSAYNNPASGTQAVNINGTDVATASPGTALNLAFDANGEAILSVSYPDAGSMLLAAQYLGTGEEAGLVMNGQDSFTAKPAGFLLSNIASLGDGAANPAAADGAGAGFIAAGEPFSVTVTAVNALGATTPNFGQEATAEGVKLSNAEPVDTTGAAVLIAPAGGNNPPLITPPWRADTAYQAGQLVQFGSNVYQAGGAGTSGATFGTGGVSWVDLGTPLDSSTIFNTSGPFSGGSAVGSYAWEEVGIIDFTARIRDGDYLGAGDVIGTSSGNVGRFFAHAFNASLSPADFAPAAGGFTYLGQPFRFGSAPSLMVTAISSGGSTLLNYEGAFWKLGASILQGGSGSSFLYGDNVGGSASLAAPASAIPFGDTSAAAGSLSVPVHATGNFTYQRPANPVAPFDADVSLQVSLLDDDGASGAASLASIGFAGDSDAGSGNPFSTSDDNLLRFGRAVLADSYGRETEAQRLFFWTHYFDGSGFVSNNADTTTAYSVLPTDPATPPNLTNPLCSPVAGPVVCSNVTVSGSNVGHGQAFTLSAPGAGKHGALNYQLAVDSWLQYDWDSDGITDNPVAHVKFGIFRGDDRFIYWREVE